MPITLGGAGHTLSEGATEHERKGQIWFRTHIPVVLSTEREVCFACSLSLFEVKSCPVLIRTEGMCIISPRLENRDIQNEHLLLISQTAVELRRISWEEKIRN